MQKRSLRFESLEDRRLLAVWAGGEAAALPAPTSAVPAGHAVGDVYIASTADIDGDGFIGPAELSYLSYGWFSTSGKADYRAASDLDGDGFIGPGDYALLSSYWFKTNDQLPESTKSYSIYPSDLSNWFLFGDRTSNISAKSGTLSLNTSGGALEAVCDYEDFADGLRVTFDFKATGSASAFAGGAELAVQESGERYYCEIRSDKISLYYVGEGGTMTLLRSTSYTFNAGTPYTVWAQAAGGQVACGVGGQALIGLDDNTLSGGRVGFYASGGVSAFSNISVEFNPDKVENTPVEEDPQIVRIVTFNIRACRGFDSSWGVNPQWAGSVLAELHPDVAGLQEVDNKTSRSGGVDQISVLGEITGLDPFFAKAISYGGGEYGIGALTGLPVISVRRTALPGSDEARTLLELEFDDFVLFNTHLSLTASSRQESAAIIKGELARYNKPVILVGDFNMNNMTEWNTLFGDTWTILSPAEPSFPADSPTRRIDFIMIADPTGTISVSSGIWTGAVVENGVVPVIASDHRPVYVDLNLTPIKKNL